MGEPRTSQHLSGAQQIAPDDSHARPGTTGTAMTLRRLLAVATLTPPQAALLTRDLADCVDGQLPSRVDDAAMVVTDSGLLRPVCDNSAGNGPPADDAAPPSTRSGCQPERDQIDGAVQVAQQLGRNAERIRPHAPNATVTWPSVHFTKDSQVDDQPDVATQLRTESNRYLEDADSDAIARLRAEVGALVAAISGEKTAPTAITRTAGSGRPAVVARPAHRPAKASWHPSDRQAWHRRRPKPPWRLIVTAIVAGGLAVILWWGAPQAWDEVRDRWNDLFAAEPPPRLLEPLDPPPPAEAAEPSTNDDPGDGDGSPAEVEPLAPESAGSINSVSMTAVDGDCEAGAECLVQVEIALAPAASSREVSWSFQVFDRCDEETSTLPGVTVLAQPGWTQVWGNSFLSIPAGTALAVIAVTDSPDAAASSPMLLPADGSC